MVLVFTALLHSWQVIHLLSMYLSNKTASSIAEYLPFCVSDCGYVRKCGIAMIPPVINICLTVVTQTLHLFYYQACLIFTVVFLFSTESVIYKWAMGNKTKHASHKHLLLSNLAHLQLKHKKKNSKDVHKGIHMLNWNIYASLLQEQCHPQGSYLEIIGTGIPPICLKKIKTHIHCKDLKIWKLWISKNP